MRYSDKLNDPRWLKRKSEIVTRDDFKCQFWHKHHGPFSVHHKYYEYGRDPWDYPDEALITVCQKCHDKLNDRSEDMYNCKCFKWKQPLKKHARIAKSAIEKIKKYKDQKYKKIYFEVLEEQVSKIFSVFENIKGKH